MEKSNEILESRKKEEEEEEKRIDPRENFLTLLEFPCIETARYSACLCNNTLDVGAPLRSFRRLSPTSTRDKKERQREKKEKKKERKRAQTG